MSMSGSPKRGLPYFTAFLLPLTWAFALTLWFEPSEISIRNDPALGGIAERLNDQGDLSPERDAADNRIDVGPGRRLVSGTIESSFAASADESGLPPAIVDQFVDLLGERIEFRRDIRRGATFSIMYALGVSTGGKPGRAGVLLAASLKNNGRTMAAIRYEDSQGKSAYYDETGQVLGKQFLRYPLKFSRITSVFSTSRFHPILNRSRPHNGVDFAAPVGTAVRSVADGTVTVAGTRGEAGTMLRISHGDRYSTAYLHLSSIVRGLAVGSRVRRGQIIGAVGMSGAATGPHLHFALFDHDAYLNPLKSKLNFVTANSAKMPQAALRLALQQLETGFVQLAQNSSHSEHS